MPFQLTYHSLASRELSGEDVKSIMTKATTKNKKLGITGCLIHHNNFFLQILEGEEQAVLDLFNTIKFDNRNEHVTLLSTDVSEQRIFKDWAMALYHLPEKGKLGAEEEHIKNKLIELSDSSDKSNFTLKVFWYNVRQILRSEGYYREMPYIGDD